MPRTCTICSHDLTREINVRLVKREPYRHIASRYDVGYKALERHTHRCIPTMLADAHVDDATVLSEQLEREKFDIQTMKQAAIEQGDIKVALLGIDKALKALELEAKVQQLVTTGTTVNVLVMPQWIELRAKLIQALAGHPAAKESVLRAIEGGRNG